MVKNKSYSIICFATLACILLVTSCKKETKVKKSTSQNKEVVASDTIFDRKSPYYYFIQKTHPEALKCKLMYFRDEDLDFDGKNEAVIAFGSDFDGTLYKDFVFVLKNENGKIKEIKADFELPDILINEIKLISLQGEKQKFIYFNIVNPPTEKGFFIYKLINNEIKQVYTSASIIAKLNYVEFKDELIDTNHDGKFDEYVQVNKYYHFDLKNTFVFDNGKFKLKKSDYLMENYPENITDVLIQYICIKSLKSNSIKINQREEQLFPSKNVNGVLLDNENWKSIYDDCVSTIDPVNINTTENEITGTIDFSNLSKNQKYILKFWLNKLTNKWQIIKLDITKDDEK